MKKLLILSVSVLLFVSLHAQVPFPTDGAIWVNTEYTYSFNPPNPIPDSYLNDVDNYCVNGQDTTIQGNDYTQVFFCDDAYKGALREVNSAVYFVPADSTDEYLLYDFAAQVSQVLENVYVGNHNDESFMLQDFTVQQIGTEIIGGVTRRVVWADNFRWIEGIGCETGLFMEPWTNVSMYANFLECMSVNGTTLFPVEGNGACPLTVSVKETANSEISLRVYPNPTAQSVMVEFGEAQNDASITVYNVAGQQLQAIDVENVDRATINLKDHGMYFLTVSTSNGLRKTYRVVRN
ncbi:MAG: T9SS type A sorting domain-containing protein [Flavobacteriales bacterium]|nr:T9SS type A sorting domain-containing protein [Flavobacteriales bacterium]